MNELLVLQAENAILKAAILKAMEELLLDNDDSPYNALQILEEAL